MFDMCNLRSHGYTCQASTCVLREMERFSNGEGPSPYPSISPSSSPHPFFSCSFFLEEISFIMKEEEEEEEEEGSQSFISIIMGGEREERGS